MRRALLLLLALGMATGCGADFWYFETNNLSGGPTVLIVAWSDSPVDQAESVRVALDRLEVYGPDGVEVLTDQRRTFELLDLQHGQVAQLARKEIPSGIWQGLRFHLATEASGLNTIRIGGVTEPLTYTGAGAHVIDVPYAMTLPEDVETTVHVDFNVRMSVIQTGDGWVLVPRLEPIDPAVAGWLLGTVEAPSGAPIPLATVSAQQGAGEVLSARTLANGTFRLGPLAPGLYALVVTAPGYAPGYVPDARVFTGTDSGAYDFVLLPAGAGAVQGSVPGSGGGQTIRVHTAGGLLAVVGVDPVTATFSLPDLPVGTYTLELWDAQGRLDVLPSVQVTAGQTTHVAF